MTTETSAADASTQTGEATASDTGLDEHAAVDAILSKWGVSDEGTTAPREDKTASATPGEHGEDEGLAIGEDGEPVTHEQTEETHDQATDGPADKGTPARRSASDDDEVVIPVDGKELKVAVKDLKRLYGQETALTRKSQEVADARKVADNASQVALGTLGRLYDKAREAFKPYEQLDLFKLSRELPDDEFDAIRTQAQKAHAEVKYFETELQGYQASLQATRQEHTRQEAAKAVVALRAAIPAWNEDLYNDIRTYAVSNGMNREIVDNLTDPSAILILNKARLYDKARARAKDGVRPAAAVVPRSAARPSATTASVGNAGAQGVRAASRLAQTGSRDDAVAAVLAKWGVSR
jgi:hypothetical protein